MGTKSGSKAKLEDRPAFLVSPLENCTDNEIRSRENEKVDLKCNIFQNISPTLCFLDFRAQPNRENVHALEKSPLFFPISLLPKTVSRLRSTRFASLTPLASLLVSSSSLQLLNLFPGDFPLHPTTFLSSSSSPGLDSHVFFCYSIYSLRRPLRRALS